MPTGRREERGSEVHVTQDDSPVNNINRNGRAMIYVHSKVSSDITTSKNSSSKQNAKK